MQPGHDVVQGQGVAHHSRPVRAHVQPAHQSGCRLRGQGGHQQRQHHRRWAAFGPDRNLVDLGERRLVRAKRRVDGAQHARVAEDPQDRGGPRFVEHALQLVAQPVALDGVQVGQVAVQRPLSRRFDAVAVAAGVPGGPQDASRVVAEAAVVQRAHQAAPQVRQAAELVLQVAPRLAAHLHGHGVDGEIAPGQVIENASRPDAGQRARMVVALGAGHRQVKRDAARPDLVGAELGRRDDLAAERSGQLASEVRAAGGAHQVDVGHGQAQQRVPDRATHQVQAHAAPRRLVCGSSQQLPLLGGER